MIILVDAKNLLFRAHFAHESLRDSSNRPTGAMYGFLASLRSIKRDYPNARYIVCWEGGVFGDHKSKEFRNTWRKDIFPEYKANRQTGEQRYLDALTQIPVIVDFLDLLDVKQIEIAGLEADDLISLLCHATDGSERIIVYSNDFDLYQLLPLKHVRIARPAETKYELISAKAIRKEHGVRTRDWPKFRALSGDSSDNIKVLKGVGPVGAKKMLADGVDPSVQSFSSLPAHVRKQYREKIADQWERLHAAWRISKLPQSEKDLFQLSKQQETNIKDYLKTALTKTTIPLAADLRSRMFLRMCTEYEMVSFIGSVGTFFSL